MAVKGAIDHFIEVPALKKELDQVTAMLDKFYVENGKRTINIAVAGNQVKDSKGVSETTANQKKLTEAILEGEKAYKRQYEAQVKADQLRQKNEIKKEEAELKKLNAEREKSARALQNEAARLEKVGKEYDKLSKDIGKAKVKAQEYYLTYGPLHEKTQQAIADHNALQNKMTSMHQAMGNHRDDVGRYGKVWDEFRGKWQMVVAGWAAGIAAISGIATVMKNAIQGAMEDERAERKLTLALDGNAKAAERLLRFKQKLMETTLFGEEEIMKMINYGLAMGRNETETKKLVAASIALSNATGGQLDVMGAMDQLNKTYSGDLGRLKKYTGELTDEQLRNGAAIEVVNKNYGKFMSEGMNSMEGEVLQMKKWWGEAWDYIGLKAMQIINGVRAGISAITSIMSGGVSSRGLASQKAENTRAQQFAAHQEKMDQINAEIDKNKELLKVNLATQKGEEKSDNDKIESIKRVILTYEELARAYRILQTMGTMPKDEKITPLTPKESTGITNKPGQVQGASFRSPLQDQMDMVQPKSQFGSEIAAESEKWNQKISIAANAVSQIDSIINASYQNRLDKIDIEIEKDKEAKEKEIKEANGNSAKIKEINARYDAKEKEREKEKRRVQREQAKYQKTSATVQAVINTALGVTNALTVSPFILGMILALLAAATGAAEIAIIQSQPLPSYKTGTKGTRQAELAKVHAGEAIVYPGGQTAFTGDVPERLAYLPKGTQVIPRDELVNLAGQAASFMPRYDRIDRNSQAEALSMAGFSMIKKAIEDKPETSYAITNGELHKFVKRGSVYEEWINDRVRL